MRHDRSDRRIRWSWIIWACFAIGLGVIPWAQVRIDRYNHAQQIASVTAATQQLALSTATQSTVFHYKETHNYGDLDKPTLEQFLKDCNGGRALGNDGIWQDPATGGKVRIVSMADGTFTAMLDTDFPTYPPARYSWALWNLRDMLDSLFCVAWVVLCVTSLIALATEPRRTRIVLGQWLTCLSLSIMFMGFMGPPVEKSRWWGMGFLTISGLYLAGAIIFGRAVDPTPRCVTCRYNLTENASGICPECGTPVKMTSRPAIV